MRHLRIIYSIAITIFTLVPSIMYGQFVSYGENPARIRWMQIDGNTYKVVYPQGMDSLAKRYLWLLEGNSSAVMAGLGGIKPARIPVLLNNRTVRSNGTVVWAPKRMELYTIPPAGGYPQDWAEQLAIHESRHVGQMTHFTKGIYKLGGILIGQQAPSLGVGIYPSRWMLEGDAVIAETELTGTGRGRNAEFMEYYRMATLVGEKRGWEQWKLGSYKKYTPDIYAFGYLINSTIRYTTGKYDYAGEVLENFVKNFYTPLARDISYKESVGATPKKFLQKGFSLMGGIWQEEAGNRGRFTEADPLLDKNWKDYREYISPMPVGEDSVLYIRYSYNNPAALVLVAGGEEKVLRSFAVSSAGFSRYGNYIYFAGETPNPRWSKEVYRNIFRYDIAHGGITRLTSGKYYNYPQASATGDSLLVVEYLPEGGSRLCILDSRNAGVLDTIEPPYGGQLTEGVWIGGKIYSLAITDAGIGLFEIDASGKGEWKRVVKEQTASITNLHAEGDALYFLSDIDGVRNVYMLYPHTGKMLRLTNARYGAGEPYISGGNLYYTSLEPAGKFPVKVSLDEAGAPCGSMYEPSLQDGVFESPYRYVVADELSLQASEALGRDGLQVALGEGMSDAVPRRYSKLGNLFRFHSWAPFYYNVDRIMEQDYDRLYDVISLGATAYSQNTLGTAVTMLGYSYRYGEHAGHAKFTYSGWYPSFRISADINDEECYNVMIQRGDSVTRRIIVNADRPLVEVEGVAYIPLDYSSHGWRRAVVPQIGWEFNNNGHYDYAKGKYLFSNTVMAALQVYQMRETAHSAIYPKWGIGAIAKWRTAVGGGENFGSEASMYLYGYVPGFAPGHGVRLTFSAQRQYVDGKNYYMGNMVGMPRGFAENFYGEKYCMGTADYALPVYLGDVHLWKLAYLKRLQVIPFADYAKMQDISLYSCGATLLLDFAPFSMGLDVSFGIRYAYNGSSRGISVDKDAISFLISTSLF